MPSAGACWSLTEGTAVRHMVSGGGKLKAIMLSCDPLYVSCLFFAATTCESLRTACTLLLSYVTGSTNQSMDLFIAIELYTTALILM